MLRFTVYSQTISYNSRTDLQLIKAVYKGIEPLSPERQSGILAIKLIDQKKKQGTVCKRFQFKRLMFYLLLYVPL